MRSAHRTLLATVLLVAAATAAADAPRHDVVEVPAGVFETILVIDEREVAIDGFLMATTPVTNAAYLAFVEAEPRWRRSRAPTVFAASGYLRHWDDDVRLGERAGAEHPVTNVPWYAAMSYCDWVGGRLPSEHEWEYVAGQGVRGDDAAAVALFAWYSDPTSNLRPVASRDPNAFGVHDLHGLVLEWVEDFETVLPGTDDGSPFGIACGAASRLLAGNGLSDQLALMRHIVRMNFSADRGTSTLGFRCVWDLTAQAPGGTP